MLARLTAGQEALPSQIRDKWLAIGLSTKPTDRASAEEGVRLAYAAANLTPPSIFIWLQSPLRGAIGAGMLTKVEAQVRDQVEAQVWAQIRQACWGQHDGNWLGFLDSFGQFEISGPERCNGLTLITQSCGWWWPFANAVIMTERPISLHTDDQHRLHCEGGPALLYSDGWGIWASHGLRVTQQVIEAPQTLTVQQISTESNAEVRRVMVERFGRERYIRESGAKLVHRDDWGTLWKANMGSDEPLVCVEVVNATPKPDGTFHNYFLRVHPELRPLSVGPKGEQHYGQPQQLTARNAVASTFGLRGEEYDPAIQT